MQDSELVVRTEFDAIVFYEQESSKEYLRRESPLRNLEVLHNDLTFPMYSKIV